MSPLPSVHQGHKFSEVPRAEIQRSSFDRSFGYKTTFDAGLLIPFYVDEALPGDTFNLRTTGFARLATPLKPLMDNMFLETFFFAVPNRLLWDNWERFNGAQDNPASGTDYTVPTISAGLITVGSLADYFGLPTGTGTAIQFNSLHFRAYNLIWNEWFRDQNMQNSVVVDTDDGPDTYGDYVLLRRGKRHDYFTSCLPWPQKGDAVASPLSGLAPIQGIGMDVNDSFSSGAVGVKETDNTVTQTYTKFIATDVIGHIYVEGDPILANEPAIYADLESATGIDINSLRQAFQIQKLLEKDARGGTRYTEVIKAHFGVTSPDARLQRPEYLGGGSTPVNISPIAQTGEAGSTPQGNLAAMGTVQWSGHGFVKSFTEHCTLLGLVCVRADLTYQQGMERLWSRQTRYDFFWPSLAHIGEQAVLRQEIYATGTDVDDETVFGYQERYAEYRYKPSKITGLFRSTAAGTLDIWHLSQEFTAPPVLGATFIEENPPIDRVIAVPTEPHFLFDSYTRLRCARPMPVYGVPGLIDHF